MAEIKITAENFDEEVLGSDIPVLVDFWAQWCGPCRMLSPILQTIDEEQAGKLKIGKIDVDEEPALASRFGIMNIPTLLVFKNGEITAKSVGFQLKEKIEALL